MPEIEGIVRSGQGKSSKVFRKNGNRRIRELTMLFGWAPYPGTLNVSVTGLDDFVRRLGEPVHRTEAETAIGPLRWWAATLRFQMDSGPPILFPVWLVRGLGSRAPYLELVSSQRLRSLGIRDGDRVRLIVRTGS